VIKSINGRIPIPAAKMKCTPFDSFVIFNPFPNGPSILYL
jgi:hypothetical protein